MPWVMVSSMYLLWLFPPAMCNLICDFSFWSYELSKRAMTKENETQNYEAMKVLLCGGLAGVVTWASIFPLGNLLMVRCSSISLSKLTCCYRCNQDESTDMGSTAQLSLKSCVRCLSSTAGITVEAVESEHVKAKHFRDCETSIQSRRSGHFRQRARHLQCKGIHCQCRTMGCKCLSSCHLGQVTNTHITDI